MMRSSRTLLLLAAILATGLVRLPIEAALTKDLRDRGLLLTSLDSDTKAKLGQTSAAVALGGLRTVVAAFQNLRAHSAFLNQDWHLLGDVYGLVTTLAPRTLSYWQTGGWHLATNAPAYYREATELPAPRRAELRRSFTQRGINFLKQGARNTPDHWEIPYQLASLYGDPAKAPDLDAAIEWIGQATAKPNCPDYVQRQRLYLLARHPHRQAEALAVARDLFANPRNRVANLLAHLYALEHAQNVPANQRHGLDDLFPDHTSAYRAMATYWRTRHPDSPAAGLPEVLARLEAELGIPAAERVGGQP